MLRILVSSTFEDLRKERNAVRSVIAGLAADGLSVTSVAMEDFGALAESTLRASEEFAQQADIVVLVVGGQYGSTPPDERRSFTHAEWDIVRRYKIPCFAYMLDLEDARLSADAFTFRELIKTELTVCAFRTIHDLKRSVRKDLEQFLKGFDARLSWQTLDARDPPVVDPTSFQGRSDAIEELRDALREEGVRVGVWGPPGIGKTTLIARFFRLRYNDLHDPVWLRVDDLFGREPGGGVQISARRWEVEPLVANLRELLKKRPRAILIFDNAQAVPLMARTLAHEIGHVRLIFLSWDADALPPCHRIIRLGPLSAEESRNLVLHYARGLRSPDLAEVDTLCKALGNHPLLLSMTSRRLQHSPELTIAEEIKNLSDAQCRLDLEGPTIDRASVKVRSVILASYHFLEAAEQRILSALAAVPAQGISEETLAWLANHIEGPRKLARSVDLGLIERRSVADWRGHKYRLRSLVADFLKTVDAFRGGGSACAEYLLSEDVFLDSSIDVVTAGLDRQLRLAAPDIRAIGKCLRPLLVDARQDMRSRVRDILAGLQNREQIAQLAPATARLLRSPASEDAMLGLVALLGEWREASTERAVRRLWLRPAVRDGNEEMLSEDVALAAVRALAHIESIALEDFLSRSITSSVHSLRRAAISAAARGKVIGLLPLILQLLDSDEPGWRRAAVDALGEYDFQLEIANRILQIVQQDPDQQVRQGAAWTLGVWQDERILPDLLGRLKDVDPDTREETCSVLWRFRKAAVADALTDLALYDPATNVREIATFLLISFRHPVAGDACLGLLRSPDPDLQTRGRMLASVLDATDLPPAIRGKIADELAARLSGRSSVSERLMARAALIHLHDDRGYRGLWSDLNRERSAGEESCRWHVVRSLATWTPPGFDVVELRSLLHDPDPDMRAAAVLVAGQQRAHILRDDLEVLLEDDTVAGSTRQTIREASSEALDRISGRRERWVPLQQGRLSPP